MPSGRLFGAVVTIIFVPLGRLFLGIFSSCCERHFQAVRLSLRSCCNGHFWVSFGSVVTVIHQLGLINLTISGLAPYLNQVSIRAHNPDSNLLSLNITLTLP